MPSSAVFEHFHAADVFKSAARTQTNRRHSIMLFPTGFFNADRVAISFCPAQVSIPAYSNIRSVITLESVLSLRGGIRLFDSFKLSRPRLLSYRMLFRSFLHLYPHSVLFSYRELISYFSSNK